MEGAPKKVGKSFSCTNNLLTSLKDAPKKVGDGFYCGSNKLTSLEGAPRTIPGYFACNDNLLTSLEGAPNDAYEFWCSENPGKFTEKQVRAVCNVWSTVFI